MAEGIISILTPQELAQLNRLSLESRYVVEGNLAGRHRSPNKGSSSEFSEHRAYVTGDDPKHIDWKVLGRTDKYYIRRYEDETNLRVYLVVDRSGSMRFTSGSETKYHYACHLAAAIGYVVVKLKDSVGLYLYSNKLDIRLAARNSMSHLNNLVKTLLKHKPASATTLTGKMLNQVAESVHRRALILIFSDLFDDPEHIIPALAHFRQQNHDVIIFHIVDPTEMNFSFKKGAKFVDMETGEAIVADPRTLIKAYTEVFNDFLKQYREACTEMNIDYRLIDIGKNASLFVQSFLTERKRLAK